MKTKKEYRVLGWYIWPNDKYSNTCNILKLFVPKHILSCVKESDLWLLNKNYKQILFTKTLKKNMTKINHILTRDKGLIAVLISPLKNFLMNKNLVNSQHQKILKMFYTNANFNGLNQQLTLALHSSEYYIEINCVPSLRRNGMMSLLLTEMLFVWSKYLDFCTCVGDATELVLVRAYTLYFIWFVMAMRRHALYMEVLPFVSVTPQVFVHTVFSSF